MSSRSNSTTTAAVMSVDDVPFNLANGQFTTLETALFLCFVVPLILFTLASNSLVVRAICTHGPLKNPSNVFLMSLAVTDLVCAAFVMPVACYYNVVTVWYLGKAGCQMWIFVSLMLSFSSIFHLCAIAIDRYRAITRPLAYGMTRTNRKSVIIICMVWASSFLVASPPFLFDWGLPWPEVYYVDTPCTVPQSASYVIYVNLGVIYIPLLIISSVYVRLYFLNRARFKKRISRSVELTMIRKRNSSQCEQRHQEQHQQQQQHRQQQKEKEQHEKQQQHEQQQQQPEITMIAEPREVTPSQEEEEESPTSRHITESSGIKDSSQIDVAEDDIIAMEDDSSPAKECVMVGSNIQNLSNDLSHKINITAPKCQTCQGVIGRNNQSNICQICSLPNDLILAAEKSRMAILVQQDRQSMLMTSVIICTFIICWLPGFTIFLALAINPSIKLDSWIISLVWWLCYANSACNPIIYTIFNKDFRKAFIKICKS